MSNRLPFLLSLLIGLAGVLGAAPVDTANCAGTWNNPPDLFAKLLGKTDAEITAKLDAVWQQLFYGNDRSQRVYYPVGDDMAYLADIANNDVRTEGMSYGMMIAVQTGHRAEFDRLWKWADKFMRHTGGPRAGYFAWHCKFDGTQLDPGSASDGEEWFAMALFFAAHRWRDSASAPGIFNYEAQAQSLLHEMLHKPVADGVTPIFNRAERQVVFAPSSRAARFTDPSYHLPAFYELWARWSSAEGDRKFWAEAARTSRAFFHQAANPVTGLMPEYANFDGSPFLGFGAARGDFRFDARRTLANVALDYAWWHADPWQVEQSNRVLRFLTGQGPAFPNQYSLDGKPPSTGFSSGLLAMAAVAGLAADPDLARPFVQRLWDMPVPDGQWRYYDGMLYCLALLEVSGRFQIFPPPAR